MRNRRTLGLIRLYQETVSHRLNAKCCFEVSCSRYAEIAYAQHTWVVASWMVVGRLSRCTIEGFKHHRRKARRNSYRLLRAIVGGTSLGMMVIAWIWMIALPAGATINGNCEAQANGQSVASNTISNPLRVKEHGSIFLLGKAPANDGGVEYSLNYAGIRFGQQRNDFQNGLIRTTVPVDRYATYGVGNYRLDVGVHTYAEDCAGSLHVTVEGNPMDTPAGKAAAGAEAAAAVGLVSSVVAGNRARVPEGMKESEFMDSETASELDKRSKEFRREETYGAAPTAEEVLIKWPWEICGFFLISAIVLTLLAAATGGSPRKVKVPWKPRLSFVGIGSGLLLGLATFVLLQQYAVIFPTRNLAIVMLAGGVLLGIILPTRARIRALKKALRA